MTYAHTQTVAQYQTNQLIDTDLQRLVLAVCLVLACGMSNIGSGQRQSGPFRPSSKLLCGVQLLPPGPPKLAHWLAHDCFASSGAPMALGQASSALTAV